MQKGCLAEAGREGGKRFLSGGGFMVALCHYPLVITVPFISVSVVLTISGELFMNLLEPMRVSMLILILFGWYH